MVQLQLKKPHFETKFESYEDGRTSSGHASGSSTDSMKKRAVEDSNLDVMQSSTLLVSLVV